MKIKLTNNNPYDRHIILVSNRVIDIRTRESIELSVSTESEYEFYKQLESQGFTIENISKTITPRYTVAPQPAKKIPPLVTEDSLKEAVDSIPTPVQSDPVVATQADEVLDKALDEMINTPDDNVGVITESNESERDLTQLESWEYKRILSDLGVETKARSASALLSLVQSNMPADYDWQSVIK